jgi:hypothetical protein
MLLAKKIKLEVTDEDATTLEFMQGKCRGLYNENSAHNILARFFARLEPHMERISVRYADVFTAIEHV